MRLPIVEYPHIGSENPAHSAPVFTTREQQKHFEDEVKVQQTPLFFAAIRINWEAKRILITYLDRRRAPFGRETFNEDIKGHLSFEAYQPRLFQAIRRHCCLCFVAYSSLSD